MLNATASEVAHYVEQQQADVAFHFDRGAVSSILEQQHIGSVAQGVFVAKGHAMAHGQEVSRNELTRHRQLIMDSELSREQAYSPTVWYSDSFYSIAEMVADELGWAILPLNIAHYDNYKGFLQEVPCPTLALSRLPVRRLALHGKKLSATCQWLTTQAGRVAARRSARLNTEPTGVIPCIILIAPCGVPLFYSPWPSLLFSFCATADELENGLASACI